MNKKLLLIGAVLVIVLVVLGGVLFFINSDSGSDQENEGILEENLVEMQPEDVGLTLTSQQNNQQVVMQINDLDDVESFEYELSYDAIENGEVVSQGTFGTGPNPDEKGLSTIQRVMDLGTCSSGKCRYHKGVEEVTLTLRVNLKNGEVGIIEVTHTLE